MSDPIQVGARATPGDDTSFALRLLEEAVDRWIAIATHARSEPGSIAAMVREQSATFLGTDGVGVCVPALRENDDLGALQWLLEELQKGSQQRNNQVSPKIVGAIHRAIGLLSTERSIADATQRSARRQLYHFAYGLTHEINNPLGNILARAQQMIGSASSEHDRRSLATMVDQAMRAHEMLAEVMRAIQPSPLHCSVAEVNAVVRSVADGLEEQTQGQSIHWQCELGIEPLYASIDSAALSEALRMLGRNAIEVCGPGDTITWTLQPSHPGNFRDATAESMGTLRIAIQDTGPGLSTAAQHSAMDLYYSGREQGRGLGVSLAAVQRIVEGHSGTIIMQSEAGAGCRVVIDLPRAAVPARTRTRLRV